MNRKGVKNMRTIGLIEEPKKEIKKEEIEEIKEEVKKEKTSKK